MQQGVIEQDYVFLGHMRPPVVGSPDSGTWRSKIVGAAPPTCKAVNGVMQLALTAANEAQNVCFYMGDELPFSIDKLIQCDIWARCSAALDATVKVSYGLVSARNDDPDVISALALFRLGVGSNVVKVETDDNVTDVAAVASQTTLGATNFVRHCIEFGSGVNTNSGALSTGGKSAVKFSIENARGQLRKVDSASRFDMSQYSSGLQLFAQIQKTAGVVTGTLEIERMRVRYRQG